MMKNIILIILTNFILHASAFSITLEEALTSAYKNNDQIKSNQNVFLAEIEKFSQALSEFMPQISANINQTNQKTKFQGGPASTTNKQLDRQLQFNQPIFNGGRSVALIKEAQSSFRVSRSKYYESEQKTLLDVIKGYLACYATQEKYEIASTSLQSNQKQLEATEEKIKVGEGTKTDRANAISSLASAEAQQLIAYANMQSAKAQFFLLTGIEAENINMPPLPNNLPNALDEIMNKARIKNFQLDQTRNKAIADKAHEGVPKGALLPQVSFSVSAGNSDITPPNNPEYKQNSLTTKVSVNIPILAKGGAEYSEIRVAKKQTRLSVIALDRMIKAINADSMSKWQNFEAQKSSINAYEEAVVAAQTAYDGIFQEELVGSKNLLDVLNALEKLNKAKMDRVDSIVQYITSAYELKQLMGELTAKSLKLKVNHFSPEDEFKKSKIRIIGF